MHPNLQNIPIRTAEGRKVREAFVAPAGSLIASADYSQIELRIMAHLSGDEALLRAFHQGLDVHKATAAEVFGLTPDQVTELRLWGHQVLVQKNAGEAIGFMDEHYVMAGAQMVDCPSDIFTEAEMIVKVKEPQPEECKMLRSGQVLFTYLHLAPDLHQTQALVQSNAICIAYETVTSANGRLPLLAPMSEVAGRMSIQAAAHHFCRSALPAWLAAAAAGPL